MIEVIINTALVLCGMYVLVVLFLLFGLFRLATFQNPIDLPVTVIISAKNEENNIAACLAALKEQTYPSDKTEIIVVNDRSLDRTEELAQSAGILGLKIITIAEQIYPCPKKNAIHHGVMASRGEILFTTDADCRPEPEWISSTIRCFAPKVGMIIGYAPLRAAQGFFSPLVSLQGLAVAALSAGSAGMRFPLACSGRNLAYRRSAYDAVGGFEGVGHRVGGDDVYLMNKIAKTPYQIAFNLSTDGAVPSQVHTDNQFNRQVRYQSKTRHFGLGTLVPSLAVYIFHLILFLLPVWLFYAPTESYAIGLCFLVKVIADAGFLSVAAKRFGCFRHMIWFPLFEFLLFPYIVIICAMGTITPPRWK
jgi:biofilm PGA synthesis N-glycosyltransferase PgaC